MALTGAQVAHAAYQAGWRGDALADIVSIAYRESRWDPSAHRTDQPKSSMSGDLGITQINYVNWPTVSQQLNLTSRSQLLDPVINFKAAKILYDGAGGSFSPGWTAGPGGWTEGGDPFHGVDRNRGRQAVEQAQSAGLFQQSYGSNPTPTGDSSAAGIAEKFDLPADMEVVVTPDGPLAVFTVAPGLNMAYTIDTETTNVDLSKARRAGSSEFSEQNTVNAGMADELATVGLSFGNFGDFWKSITGRVLGYGNPASDDAGVLRVLADFAARPDMTEAELQNRLRDTSWFKTRTTSELEWNSLSPAEQDKRRNDMKARMSDAFSQYMGGTIDEPTLDRYLEDLSSGRVSYNTFVAGLKERAKENENTPYGRQQRTEEEAQRQRPIDIENTAQRVRETAERWGIQFSNTEVNRWAGGLVEKKLSDEDLMMQLRQQSQTMFPWKPPEMETVTAAGPWMQTFERVMERKASLFDPKVQKALSSGTPVWEFEQELKKSPDWLGTKNGQSDMYSAVSEAGRRMGFA